MEAPSTLFERLAWHHGALSTWALSPVDGASPIPQPLLASLRAGRDATAASSALQQVVFASLDLRLHASPPASVRELRSAAAACVAQHTPWRADPEGTGAGMRGFSHLVGYGSTYYSYAYGRAISGSVWRALRMDDEPTAAAAGAALWGGLLRSGGAEDPRSAVAAVAGPSALVCLAPGAPGWAPEPGAALRDLLRE